MSYDESGSDRDKRLREDAERLLSSEPEKDWPEDAQELVRKLQIHHHDISLLNKELSRTRIELEESRQQCIDLYDYAPVGYLTLDKQGFIIAANLTAAGILGAERESLQGKPFSLIVVQESLDLFHLHMSQALNSNGKVTCELAPKKADGTTILAKLESRSAEINQSKSVHTILTDITESRQVENALKESEERYRTAIENFNDGVAIMRKDSHLYVNQKFLEMFGYDNPDEIIGKPNSLTVHPDDYERVKNINVRRQGGGSVPFRYEFKGIRKDGAPIYIEVSATDTLHQGQPVSLIYLRDVTDRRHAQETLQEAEEKYRTVVESSLVGVYIVQDNLIRFVNKRWTEIYGYTYDEAVDKLNPLDLTPLQDKRLVEDNLKKRLDGDVDTVEYTTRAIRKNGTIITVRILGGSMMLKGRPAISGTVIDVTESERMEKTLRENQRAMATLLSNLQGMAYRCRNDRQWTMEYVSQGCLALTGHAPEDLIANSMLSYSDLIHEQDRGRVWEEVQRALADRTPFHLTYRIVRSDGGVTWAWEQGRGIFQDDGTLIALEGFIADITDRKRAEEQVASSLREKEVLLREIHHRVKNNLQVVASLLNMQSRFLDDAKATEMFTESINRVKSMALIHDKLYQSENLARIDFSDYAKGLASSLLIAYSFGKDITFDADIDSLSLDIDLAMPCGLIINELLSNSLKHAFPGDRPGKLGIRFKKNADHYCLTISDDGIGFPPEINFTATETLGMQLVTTLVDQIEGTIELKRNGGTQFTIVFKEIA